MKKQMLVSITVLVSY